MSKSSSPWGTIGAWAAEAERAEAEEREEQAAAAAAAAAAPPSSFPSLKDAVAIAPKQKKKTKMSLQEFNQQQSSSAFRSRPGLTPDEMLRLPTGPKERDPDEMPYGGGRGFPNYGSRPGAPRYSRDEDGGSWAGGGDNRRTYGGGFEDDNRRRGAHPPRVSEFDQPSRADEVDNWAMGKKPISSLGSGLARPGRYGSLGTAGGGGGGGGGFSKADEDDNWGANKKSIAPPPPQARSSGFGSGFGDSRPEPDRWVRDGGPERQRLVLDPPKNENVETMVVKVNKSNPFGAARPREEVLAEKGMDWKKLDSEIEAKKPPSRPTSSHSSRPGSSQSMRSEGSALQGIGVEGAVKPRPKVNPFGDAKPREVLLEEKGLDWRKIDLELEHKRVDRPETEEEKLLKEQIEHLKKESQQKSGDEHGGLHDLILQKEKDLELLIRDLDDKVRFGQRAGERPGSGAGRVAGFSERPPSRPGSYDGNRGVEILERPTSRGTGEGWSRQTRDRVYFGSRDLDRSRSRERW